MSPHPTADVEIRLINADGSEAEISGNGTRCVAAYICDSQEKELITIQTGAGLRSCMLTARSETTYEFEIEMGQAIVKPERVLAIPAGEVRGIPVSLGNPHYVVFVPQFPPNWQQQAAEIQASSEFPHGVNVEMVMIEGEHQADAKHDITVRFFERGVGETQSSGTGSCASAVAAISTGRAASPVRVHAPGGTQTVRQKDGPLFLRGPALLVGGGQFFMGDFVSDSV
jgi:diaminopimelate epimerase